MAAIRLFEGVKHVLTVVNTEKKRLAVVPCAEEESASVEWARVNKQGKWDSINIGVGVIAALGDPSHICLLRNMKEKSLAVVACDGNAKLQIVLNAVEKGSNPWGCTDCLNQKKKILETGVDVYELMNDYPVHTKAVLINDRLSVVGSYNLDMQSTYLDTELMLVIDSEKLSQQIHETESDYMEKSKEVLANGQETEGAKYQGKVLNRKKKLYYGVLRIIIRPLRQLL